jgi:hypothetical protein
MERPPPPARLVASLIVYRAERPRRVSIVAIGWGPVATVAAHGVYDHPDADAQPDRDY